MPELSRRQILSVAAFAGATVTAPVSLAKANPDAELLKMVSAYREADAAVEIAPGGPVLDAALDRLQQLLEVIIGTQAKTSQGAALKMSVIAGANPAKDGGFDYLDGEVNRTDHPYDVRLAFSVVRDFLMMGVS
jgi:hypothetical protein